MLFTLIIMFTLFILLIITTAFTSKTTHKKHILSIYFDIDRYQNGDKVNMEIYNISKLNTPEIKDKIKELIDLIRKTVDLDKLSK